MVCLRCRGLSSSGPARVLVDGDRVRLSDVPALVLLRAENRPELVCVLFRDRLLMGGDPARALVLPGSPGAECGAVWWLRERLWWQPRGGVGSDELVELRPGASWRGGRLEFRLEAVTPALFR
ncbi:unnamed protein product [marine sediment metagenome]|uniref:Uncharacterized protein n=1 Tax=marine sediment metagenome TaxID=412755 RepID=X1K718_9ZZZZ